MLAQVQKLDTPPVEYSALLPILVMLGGAVLLMVIGALLPRRAKPWWHAAFTVVTALASAAAWWPLWFRALWLTQRRAAEHAMKCASVTRLARFV